jgi:hypothetical protein
LSIKIKEKEKETLLARREIFVSLEVKKEGKSTFTYKPDIEHKGEPQQEGTQQEKNNNPAEVEADAKPDVEGKSEQSQKDVQQKEGNKTVDIELVIYERANKNPIFIAYERHDSVMPYTNIQTEIIAGLAKETYKLAPHQVIFYEKKREAELYQPVELEALGAEGKKTGQWSLKDVNKDFAISDEKLTKIVGHKDFSPPDLGQWVERPHNLSIDELKTPDRSFIDPDGPSNDPPINR